MLGASWQPPPPPTTQQTWPPAFKARPPQQGGPVPGVKRAKKAVEIRGRTSEDSAGAAAATAGDTAAEHAKGDGKSSEEVAAAACPHFTDTQNVTLVSAEGFEETKAAIRASQALKRLRTCEQYFENIGKAAWEAQKLRNKEMRGQILPLLQTRMKRAVADLQLGQFNEEAPEEPEMRTEAPAAAAHPKVRDEGPRYKMTICRHWQRGLCKKGDTCTFAHGEEERRAPTICKHWKTGTCKKGDKCAFAHSEVLKESPAKKARTKPPASEEPPEPDGFNSQGLRIRAGKAECAWYRRTGVCLFLQRCKFSHPEWDPEQDQNISNLIRTVEALESVADKERFRDAAPSSQTAASSSTVEMSSQLSFQKQI